MACFNRAGRKGGRHRKTAPRPVGCDQTRQALRRTKVFPCAHRGGHTPPGHAPDFGGPRLNTSDTARTGLVTFHDALASIASTRASSALSR